MTTSGWPKPWYTDPWQWVLVGYGVASAAFAVWIVCRPWVIGLTPKDWISLFGAAASFAVAVAAFWLGLQNAMRDRSEKLIKAALAAAQAEVTITAAMARFQGLDAGYEFRNLDDPTPAATMDAVMKAFNDPLVEVDRDTLALLVPLPAHCATRIARAFSLLSLVRAGVLAVMARWLTGSIPDSEQEHHLRKWGAGLSEAVRLLSVAQLVCQKSALEGAPSPSGEELWGDG